MIDRIKRDQALARAMVGFISGAIATVPMTAVMAFLHRRLPARERYPLPPREITMEVADAVGVKDELSQQERSAVTLLAHFGYGAAVGGVYALTADVVQAPGISKGTAFGLFVWVASYLGLLPALNLLSNATHHPARRNALMIVAHLIWGSALGLIVDLLKNGESTGLRRTVRAIK